MNDYLKFKRKMELAHANPYRSETNQFASRDNYHHIIGETVTQTQPNVNMVAKSSKDILESIKNVTKESSKLLEGKGKPKKIPAKYPELSDADLQKKLNRLKMEEQYSDLLGETKVVKSGSEKAKDVLQTIGAVAGIGVSLVVILQAIINFKKRGL